MTDMRKILVLLTMLLPCQPFPDHPPTTTCETLLPKHNKHLSQPLYTSPYSIAVSNYSYMPGQELKVNITVSRPHKGFLIQARAEGNRSPVGQFKGELDDGAVFIWCSGGLAKNSIGHSKAKLFQNISFTWRAPEISVGNIRFWATLVANFSIFWVGLQSSLVTTSLPAVTPTPVVLEQGDFTITKKGCGSTKSCYSEPPQCNNSQNCQFLVTFKKEGDNLLLEMSTDLGYASVGFNHRKEMNDTECVSCSKLANSRVDIRHYWLDYHQPIRTDINRSTDVVYKKGVYSDGILKCSFTRKIKPDAAIMRDLNRKWYYIFAWSHVFHETGGLHYHRENASYTAKHVDITTPSILENGRRIASSKVTKDDCGKGKGCWSEPSNCIDSTECQYLLKYKPSGKSVEFEITAKASWVSVGFNDKGKMDGTEAIICVKENSGALLKVDHYTMSGYDPPIKTDPRPGGLTTNSAIRDNDVVICRFAIKLASPGMRDLSSKVHLIFASGPVSGSGQVVKHTMKKFTTKPVDLTKVNLLEVSSDIFLQSHGILMSVAWLLFASIGMFMARYMKQVWPSNLCGKKTWFQVHRTLMFLTVITTIAGFVLIFYHVQGWSVGGGVHSYIGVTVTALAVIQPIMAFFRPHPGTPKRDIFNWAHKMVGISVLILAIVNCVLGVFLDSMSIKSLGWIAFIPYGVALVLVLLFEIFILNQRNKKLKQLEAKANVKDEQVIISKPSSPTLSSEEIELYKWILAGVILLTLSSALVLSIFIVTKPGQIDEI